MRPNFPRRARSRAAQLTFAAAVIALPASAAVAQTTTHSDSSGTFAIRVTPAHVRAGRPVTISGSALRADGGERVALEARLADSHRWRLLQRARVDSLGRFRFTAHLRRSALVRVVPVAGVDGASAVTPAGESASALDHAAAVRRVSVTPRVSVVRTDHAVLGAGSVAVRGRVLPVGGRRKLSLQARSGRRWQTLDRGRTTRAGRFALAYRATTGTNRRLRVLFAGDPENARASARAGTVTVYQPAIASWYYDAGLETGCGFNARYGVANKTLPCGTKVQFRYGGRTVMATVDDRGPYVAGRTWDLGQGTRAALGFNGVGEIWASVR